MQRGKVAIATFGRDTKASDASRLTQTLVNPREGVPLFRHSDRFNRPPAFSFPKGVPSIRGASSPRGMHTCVSIDNFRVKGCPPLGGYFCPRSSMRLNPSYRGLRSRLPSWIVRSLSLRYFLWNGLSTLTFPRSFSRPCATLFRRLWPYDETRLTSDSRMKRDIDLCCSSSRWHVRCFPSDKSPIGLPPVCLERWQKRATTLFQTVFPVTRRRERLFLRRHSISFRIFFFFQHVRYWVILHFKF